MFVSRASDETILDGVYVGDLAVGGMSQEQAMEEVDTYVKGIYSILQIKIIMISCIYAFPIPPVPHTSERNSRSGSDKFRLSPVFPSPHTPAHEYENMADICKVHRRTQIR